MKIACVLFFTGLLCACAEDRPARAATAYAAAFDTVMTHYDLPGLALGVIENGEVTYLRTSGELVAGSGRQVTADTLFKIASNSKAMTAAVLARQVDRGRPCARCCLVHPGPEG